MDAQARFEAYEELLRVYVARFKRAQGRKPTGQEYQAMTQAAWDDTRPAVVVIDTEAHPDGCPV